MSNSNTPFFPTTLPIGTIGDLLAGCARCSSRRRTRRASRGARHCCLDTRRSKFWASANSVADASPQVARSVIRAAMKRATGMPLAYAVGRASFRHLTLVVDDRRADPARRDRSARRSRARALHSEHAHHRRHWNRILVRSRCHSPSSTNSSTCSRPIVSLDAIDVAATNATAFSKALKSPVKFRNGSLLAPLAGETLDAIVCNPPYISFAEIPDLPRDVRDWEPSLALLCSQDGLSITRELVRQAPDVLARGGLLALEVDTVRAGMVAEMIAVDGRYAEIEVLLDLTGRERFVFARRT